MHPIFAARVRVLLYLAGWIPVLALLSFVLRSSGGITWLDAAAVLAPAVLIFAFACLSPWPICRVRPLRIANMVPLIATWAGAAAASAGIFVAAAWASGALQTRPAPHLDILFALGVILYLLSAGLHYAALAADASRAATLAAAEANSLARDAELYALRMQINPHFLFNSLHSIAALTTQDAARAREMCLRLSDFLRGSLALADHKDIPLGEELALARAYLDVEHIRFGARLQFHEEIGAACDGCRIPALLLQPLIENAVKHGIAGLIEGGSIRLAASRSGDVVHIAIENPYDPESISPTRLGVGLPQVRRRMQVRYGDAATLSIDARDSTHRVTLTFPCIQSATGPIEPLR